jgi:hypothetical protein
VRAGFAQVDASRLSHCAHCSTGWAAWLGESLGLPIEHARPGPRSTQYFLAFDRMPLEVAA